MLDVKSFSFMLQVILTRNRTQAQLNKSQPQKMLLNTRKHGELRHNERSLVNTRGRATFAPTRKFNIMQKNEIMQKLPEYMRNDEI